MNNGEIEAGPTGVENASPTETDLRVVPSMNGTKSDNNLAVDDSPSLDYSGSLDECGGSVVKGAGELFSRSQLKCCERMKFWLDCCLPGNCSVCNVSFRQVLCCEEEP